MDWMSIFTGKFRNPFNNELAPIEAYLVYLLFFFIYILYSLTLFVVLFVKSLLSSLACESFDQATGNELPHDDQYPPQLNLSRYAKESLTMIVLLLWRRNSKIYFTSLLYLCILLKRLYNSDPSLLFFSFFSFFETHLLRYLISR